jgi:hypothetical protein
MKFAERGSLTTDHGPGSFQYLNNLASDPGRRAAFLGPMGCLSQRAGDFGQDLFDFLGVKASRERQGGRLRSESIRHLPLDWSPATLLVAHISFALLESNFAVYAAGLSGYEPANF